MNQTGWIWTTTQDTGFTIVPESHIFAPLQIYEDRKGQRSLQGWKTTGCDDSNWDDAFEYGSMSLAVSPGNLPDRTTPFMYRKERTFPASPPSGSRHMTRRHGCPCCRETNPWQFLLTQRRS